MECGLIGKQGVGKTTLFTALTAHAVPVQAGSMKPNIGLADIPDPRLLRISEFIPPEKIIPARVQVVDIPGVPSGGGQLNQVLASIREVDAIAHVVQCFDGNSPASDIASMESELIMADLVVAEGSLDKATRSARSGDQESKDRLAVIERVHSMLEEERPIRSGTWDEQERGILRSYGMITAKPMLYVANVGEDDLEGSAAASVREHASGCDAPCVHLCATLESEIAELEENDRVEMLESMGIAEPALGAFARATNELLGLSTFYTAGEKEVRAWSIPQGATAPEAAGSIHGDLQRGFIRAECFHCDDLFELGSEKAIKEAGKLRSEGKSYVMQDGDVAHILFNV
jgi:GTP-binding protein YchF